MNFVYLIPYVCFFCGAFLLDIISYKRSKKIKIIIFILILSFLFFLLIFKADSVGTDTRTYKLVFDEMVSTGKISSNKDIAFYNLMLLFAKTIPNFYVFQLFSYVFFIVGLGLFAYKTTDRPILLLIVLFGTPIFPLLFSGLRQMYAIIICCLSSLLFLKCTKLYCKIGSILVYLIAIFFHSSSIVFGIFFFYKLIKINNKTFFIFVASFLLFLLFSGDLLYFLYSFKDLEYFITSNTLGVPINAIIFFIIFILCYFVNKRKGEITQYTVFLWPSFLYTLIMSTSSSSYFLTRFGFYFAIFLCPLVTQTVKNLQFDDKKNKIIYIGICFLFCFFGIYNLWINNSMGTFPYLWRFQ